MNKIYIILSFYVFVVSSCGQAIKKQETENIVEINQENEPEIITQKAYYLDDVKVLLQQHRGNDVTDFYCEAKIIVSKNGKITDSVSFLPEPVGGYYGISNGIASGNHLIFTKHGNYDGRTLIINNKGKIFNIIGGENYVDTAANLLFSIYECDISGFAVFDLKTDSVLLINAETEDTPLSIHKIYNEYFMICENNETGQQNFWKFDLKMKKVEQTDFDKKTVFFTFNVGNELQILPKNDVYCICEK
jgi:hypothetical protein